MSQWRPLEPNPAPGRPITRGYIDELVEYLEYQAAWGRPYGLLPAQSGQAPALPYLDPPDVLHLPSIRAIGARGRLLLADAADPEGAIPPLDAGQLAVGSHRIYACLCREKAPCGPLVQEGASPNGAADRLQYREYRRPQVILTTAEERTAHLDWLQVAELERSREAGVVRTKLNEWFHPPVANMRAYLRPNPLSLLASRGLAALPPERQEAIASSLRVELLLLQSIAEEASPEVAFLQAQRCLALLPQLQGTPLLLDGRLQGHRYSPDSFPEFLAILWDSLQRRENYDLYPPILEIDGYRYQRVPGELTDGDDFWTWSPQTPGFVARGVAIYMPLSQPGSVPVIQYDRQRTDTRSFTIARPAEVISGPGTAILLGRWSEQTGQIYITSNSQVMHQRLRKQLGDGHAIYYC